MIHWSAAVSRAIVDSMQRPWLPSSPTQRKVLILQSEDALGMDRFATKLLLVTALLLTAYFGAAAWRASDDLHPDLTGGISPASESGMRRR
jgi:hypothetical protein